MHVSKEEVAHFVPARFENLFHLYASYIRVYVCVCERKKIRFGWENASYLSSFEY